MTSLHIIKIDKSLPGALIYDTILHYFDLIPLNLTNVMAQQIHMGTEFGNELTRELATGNLLQTATMEKVLEGAFINNRDNGMLLNRYPRTQSQLDSLKKFLFSQDIKLERIWYFKNARTPERTSEISESEMTVININDPDELSESKLFQLIKNNT